MRDPQDATGQQAIPYAAMVQRFHAAPPGKLYCLHGDRSVYRLALTAAANVLLGGMPMALVDGTNRFDVYYIAEFARRFGASRQMAPDDLLQRMFISRAFTCYQMEAVLTERLPAFLQRVPSPVVLVFGLLDTFYDEQAPIHEVRASIQRILGALRRLRGEHVSMLLASHDMTPAAPERRALFPRLVAAMDQVYRVTDKEGGPAIVGESRGQVHT